MENEHQETPVKPIGKRGPYKPRRGGRLLRALASGAELSEGDQLARARLEAGLNARQAAGLLGVSPVCLSLWERNKGGGLRPYQVAGVLAIYEKNHGRTPTSQKSA